MIGPAVNQTARIQETCRELGIPVLLSSAFADSFSGELSSCGEYKLRGVDAKQELFSLPPDIELKSRRENAAD